MLRVSKMGFLIIASYLIFVSSVFSQERKTVIWSGDPNCGWKNSRVEADDRYLCSSLPTPRGNVSSVAHKKINLTVAFLDRDPFITVAIEISNQNDEPLMFDTDNWGAAHFRNRSDFFAGKQPIVAETSIPARDFARQMANRAKSENSVDEYLADMHQTIEVIEIRRPDGTRTRVKKIVPDQEEQKAAESRSESRTMIARNSSAQFRQNALTVKTVGPSGSVKGLVYFRRVKSTRFIVFSFSVDDTDYLFLLPRNQKG